MLDISHPEHWTRELLYTQDYKGMGVVYVGHIPKSFAEKEMRAFFEQFGTIFKLRISRSKKVKY